MSIYFTGTKFLKHMQNVPCTVFYLLVVSFQIKRFSPSAGKVEQGHHCSFLTMCLRSKRFYGWHKFFSEILSTFCFWWNPSIWVFKGQKRAWKALKTSRVNLRIQRFQLSLVLTNLSSFSAMPRRELLWPCIRCYMVTD